jgi:hypothetical protein
LKSLVAVRSDSLSLLPHWCVAHKQPDARSRLALLPRDPTARFGVTRFSYDVRGDAVNFASRMESHGLPGRHSGERGVSRIDQDEFEFEERGTTDLKGIGNRSPPSFMFERRRLIFVDRRGAMRRQ